MHSGQFFFVVFAFFAVIQVAAGHFVPRQHNGMLAAVEHRPHTATHEYGSSMNLVNSDNVVKTLDIAVTDTSTGAVNPALPSLTSADATLPTTTLDLGYMISPVYAWGHSLAQKLLPAE
ncbi:hypothetical protein K488DRAFT_82990 [Vararia minispora EC-137]|uniref:Uncharacterized protein n=1 Tax=Vararia minispora EC-137 TaxID=1314806 RepID=A0ACB8QUL8_9AGAM|nr:hypothetical protein K488DRAFT_82990 [Vararia minispora EC-137]